MQGEIHAAPTLAYPSSEGKPMDKTKGVLTWILKCLNC